MSIIKYQSYLKDNEIHKFVYYFPAPENYSESKFILIEGK